MDTPPKQNKQNKKSIYIALFLLLVLVNIFLAVKQWNSQKENQVLETEKNEIDSLYTSVLRDLNLEKLALDSLKGKNADLDVLLRQREADLDEAKLKIESMLRQGKLDKQELSNARKLIAQLKEDNKKFEGKIDSLSKAVTQLTEINVRLNEELGQEIQLTEKLTQEKAKLQEKVNLGALIATENIEVTGVRGKSSGKENTTNNAKKAEKLKICFEAKENRVADAGQKTVYVVLKDPGGRVIYDKSLGSGEIKDAESGQTVQYTTAAPFPYEKESKNICVLWSQSAPYAKGQYKVQLYQSGHKTGESTFDLK